MQEEATSHHELRVNNETYDKKFLEVAVAHQQITSFHRKATAVYMGSTGAGKSTAISIQQGVELMYNTADKTFDFVHKLVATPLTSDGFVSQTLHVSIWKDDANRTHIDTPGLLENRGNEEKMWTRNNLCLFLRSVKEIGALVIVVDYTQLQRGGTFRNLISELAPFLQVAGAGEEGDEGNEFVFDSMVFLVTRPYENGELVSPQEVRKKASLFLSDMEAKKQRKIESLTKKYPARKLVYPRSIDWAAAERESPALINEVKNLDITISLLTRLSGASTPIVISSPKTPEACRIQRAQLLHAFARVPPLAQPKLRTLGAGLQTSSLHFQNMLCALAATYLPELSLNKELLARLVSILDAEKSTLEAIANNFKLAQSSLANEVQGQINAVNRELSTARDEKKRLENSTRKVMLDTHPIYKGKWGFWTFLGQGWAEHTWRYDGETPLIDVTYSTSNLDTNKSKFRKCDFRGRDVELYLESNTGFNLNVTVHTWVYEKESPATLDRIAALEDQIDALNQTKESLGREKLAITTCTTKEQLINAITKEKKEIEDSLKKIQKGLDSKISSEDETLRMHTVNALFDLFEYLKKNRLVHTNLPPVQRKNMTDFCGLHKEVESLRSTPVVKQHAPKASKKSALPQVPFREDDSRLVHNQVEEIQLKAAEFVHHAESGLKHVASFGRKFPICCGLAILAFVFWRAAGILWALLVGFAVLLIFFGLALLFERIIRAAQKAVVHVEDRSNAILEQVINELVETRDLSLEKAQQVTNKFADNLKVDLRTNLDTSSLSSIFTSSNYSLIGTLKALF